MNRVLVERGEIVSKCLPPSVVRITVPLLPENHATESFRTHSPRYWAGLIGFMGLLMANRVKGWPSRNVRVV